MELLLQTVVWSQLDKRHLRQEERGEEENEAPWGPDPWKGGQG